MYTLGTLVTRYHLQNLLAYLICAILLATTGCTAVQPATVYYQPQVIYPLVVDGMVLVMPPASTYPALARALKDAATPILLCDNCTHQMIDFAINGWKGARVVVLVNTLETSKEYWSSLEAFVVSDADAGMLRTYAKDVLGYTQTTPKDVAITPLALRVAEFLAGVGTGGEVMLAGVTITLDDFMRIVEQTLGRGDL